MTPQEHYAEAERLVEIANGDDPRDPIILSAAQVHATLATIAAAREALAPLRAKHQRVQRLDGSWRCTSCRDAYGAHADFPTGTDRLIYREDEL